MRPSGGTEDVPHPPPPQEAFGRSLLNAAHSRSLGSSSAVAHTDIRVRASPASRGTTLTRKGRNTMETHFRLHLVVQRALMALAAGLLVVGLPGVASAVPLNATGT